MANVTWYGPPAVQKPGGPNEEEYCGCPCPEPQPTFCPAFFQFGATTLWNWVVGGGASVDPPLLMPPNGYGIGDYSNLFDEEPKVRPYAVWDTIEKIALFDFTYESYLGTGDPFGTWNDGDKFVLRIQTGNFDFSIVNTWDNTNFRFDLTVVNNATGETTAPFTGTGILGEDVALDFCFGDETVTANFRNVPTGEYHFSLDATATSTIRITNESVITGDGPNGIRLNTISGTEASNRQFQDPADNCSVCPIDEELLCWGLRVNGESDFPPVYQDYRGRFAVEFSWLDAEECCADLAETFILERDWNYAGGGLGEVSTCAWDGCFDTPCGTYYIQLAFDNSPYTVDLIVSDTCGNTSFTRTRFDGGNSMPASGWGDASLIDYTLNIVEGLPGWPQPNCSPETPARFYAVP